MKMSRFGIALQTLLFCDYGAIYEDKDVVVDGDLVTGRSGGHCHLFARKIIDMISSGRVAGSAAGSATNV